MQAAFCHGQVSAGIAGDRLGSMLLTSRVKLDPSIGNCRCRGSHRGPAFSFAVPADRTPTHGYAAPREAAMAAFAKSWRRA
jgi:hypothetical protein